MAVVIRKHKRPSWFNLAPREDVKTCHRRRFRLPNGFVGVTPLYKHQPIGAAKIVQNTGFGILDPPGMGKTIQVLYAFADLLKAGEVDCMLVVCKASYAGTWIDAVKEHLGEWVKIQVLAGEEEAKRLRLDRRAHIYIMSYALMGRSYIDGRPVKGGDASRMMALARARKCMGVLDESHVISNPASNTTRALTHLSKIVDRRVIVTGTVVADRVSSVWSQMRYLDVERKHFPETYPEFLDRYTLRIDIYVRGEKIRKIVGSKNLEELHRRMQALTICRPNAVELPPQVIVPHHLHAIGKEKKHLVTVIKELMSSMRDVASNSSWSQVMAHKDVSTLMQEARKASAAPSGLKMQLLKDRMDDIASPTIVWVYHRDVCEAVAAKLKGAVFVHGGVSNKERDRRVKAFKNNEEHVLVATMDSMRESHTLTNSWYAIFYQLDFRLLNWRQAKKRNHRITQTRPVILDVPLLRPSLDAYLFERIQAKERDAEAVDDGEVRDAPVQARRLFEYLERQLSEKE